MKVLCVVAHPDDESLFMGGTLARHAAAGDTVTAVILSDGEGSRFPAVPSRQQRRWRQFTAACKILGARPVLCHVFDDQASDAMTQLEINRRVQRLIDEYQPGLVYTHCTSDLNLDHRKTAEAVLVATRGRCMVLGAEPEWPTRYIGGPFEPTLCANITPFMKTKMRACKKYTGEMREYPHPRSERGLLERASRHGGPSAGVYAEAFVRYE